MLGLLLLRYLALSVKIIWYRHLIRRKLNKIKAQKMIKLPDVSHASLNTTYNEEESLRETKRQDSDEEA